MALVRKGKRGYAEACKALAHLIKDKYWGPEQPRSNTSQWLKGASEEAMYAIEHPEMWACGPTMDPIRFTRASDPWGTWQAASRSSSSWDRHDLRARARETEIAMGRAMAKSSQASYDDI